MPENLKKFHQNNLLFNFGPSIGKTLSSEKLCRYVVKMTGALSVVRQ